MEYFIDSADARAVSDICRSFPVAGVTTNPTILSRVGGDLRVILPALRAAIGSERLLHFEPVSPDTEGILREADAVRALVGGRLAVKVPPTPDGLRAVPLLKDAGFAVTVTAVFSPQQAMLAASCGADYIAPYINRFDTVCGGGAELVRASASLLAADGSSARLLCASFRNIRQIEEVMEAGARAVTVTPETFYAMASHPMTDLALETFRRDWQPVWGNATLCDLLAPDGKAPNNKNSQFC